MRAELTLAGLTCAALVVMLVVVLFAPLYRTVSGTIDSTGQLTEHTGSASLWDVGVPWSVPFVFLVPAAGILAGALLDRRRPRSGRPILGVVAGALWVIAILTGFSIGLFVLPLALLATLTFLASGGASLPPSPRAD